MPATTTGRLLLVALAILGLALVVPVVGAHGNETTADDAHPTDATADDWATWMAAHMTEYMGQGSVEWMEAHMGLTVEEMGEDMAQGGYQHPYDDHPYDQDRPNGYDRPYDRPGQGHGC